MASRVEPFVVTVPAGTLPTAPQLTATPFDEGRVERFEILVPPGPSGLVGFQLRHSGAGILPRDDDRWIIADNEVVKWDVVNVPDSGAWSVRAYNLDLFPHTLYIRVLVTDVARAVAAESVPTPIVQPDQSAVAPEDEQPVVELTIPEVT